MQSENRNAAHSAPGSVAKTNGDIGHNSESPAAAGSSVQNDVPDSDQAESRTHIEELIALLGNDVVLLPIPTGRKGPVLRGWQETTTAEMNDPDYRAYLAQGNIGVLLGRSSGSLCAIDIDDNNEVEPFLELNPRLRGTLITKGKRGAQIWVRVPEAYPAPAKLKDEMGEDFGEWRADGNQSVICGVHPDGMRYQRLNDAQPITIRFDEIHWPDYLNLPWVEDEFDRLVAEHGAPYQIRKGGAVDINDYFFVFRFKHEHLALWEPLEEEFTYTAPPTAYGKGCPKTN